jgi:hypothetical protein
MKRSDCPNWKYLKERLSDISLLKRSVVVCDGEDLAVPVGGNRRGGYVVLDTLRRCRQAVRQLRHSPGFPNLRIVDGRPHQHMHSVEWGDPQPHGDVHRGRYFGYSEKVIQRFLREVRRRRCSQSA